MFKIYLVLSFLIFTLPSCYFDSTLYQTNDREYEISGILQTMNKQKLMNETADWILRNFASRERVNNNYEYNLNNFGTINDFSNIIQLFDIESGKIVALGLSTFSSRTDFECRIEVEIKENEIKMVFNQFIQFDFNQPEIVKNYYIMKRIKKDIERVAYPYVNSQIEKYKKNQLY